MNDVRLFLVQCDFSTLSDTQYELALGCIDEGDQARAKRFHHREDAWKFLIGRLLRYMTVDEIVNEGTSTRVPLKFAQIQSGKPYLASPHPDPLGFNLSHDSSTVLLAIQRASDESIASDIGVDVMHAQIPSGETFSSFLESIGSTLTLSEMSYLQALERQAPSTATRALFRLWTIKEAYTKAIGSGLGFEMSRIEFDFDRSLLRVDGSPLYNWEIRSFFLPHAAGAEGQQYAATVCYRLGECSERTEADGVVLQELPAMKRIDIVTLLNAMANKTP